LDECFLGGARRRGEIVRLIEIPVPLRKRGGIFNLTRASSFELAAAVEGAIKTNFGHAIRAYLERLVAEREFWTQRAKLLVDRFIRKVGATSDPWTLRLATKFAIVYAGGRIPAEMNIAPWPQRHPFKCIADLYRRAREVVATPEEALADLLSRLAANKSSDRRFPLLKKGEALPKAAQKTAWGLRRKASNLPPHLAIHSEKLDELVRPRKHANQVPQLLAAGGYTLPGKDGRIVSQLMVEGFGSARKPYFVRVRLDRLPK
jgi:hypothetical protein